MIGPEKHQCGHVVMQYTALLLHNLFIAFFDDSLLSVLLVISNLIYFVRLIVL